ncbi:MAG: PEP/pyruvate-binding domain-containing protein, partial [Anaerolineaceae bacterium]|nr:PEP/pyruvate-binding domain-containing protein [Anaerolineaceae bacterium]
MISVDEAYRKEISPTHKTSERLLYIYLTLGQYPVLRGRIRELMREELFRRAIIERQEFEARVHSIAVETQENEGVNFPQKEEDADLWEMRLRNVRDQLTDIMFSQQLPEEEFELIVKTVLDERGIQEHDLTLSLNPELASRDLVFAQAKNIERMPKDEREAYEPRLKESKVVLIRSMISDQLPYIHIAKDWFSISDLEDIRQHKIGAGRIGGKAAGMLLAYRILVKAADEALKCRLRIPKSFYIGATEYYPFMTINNLTRWLDQKYKSEVQMRADYPEIVKDFEAGKLPDDVQERLLNMLVTVGKQPLIVRSSSLLEDS